MVTDSGFQLGGEVVISFVVLFDSLIKSLDLWTNDGSSEVAHSDGVVGKSDRLSFEVFRWRDGLVLGVQGFVILERKRNQDQKRSKK